MKLPYYRLCIRVQREKNFLKCIHYFIFTGRNEVVAKVIFLQVSVCPQGGEGVCLSACWDAIPPWMESPPLDGEPPPGWRTSPRWRTPLPPPPLGWRTPLTPDGEPPPNPGWRTPPQPRMENPPPREADSSIRSTSGRYASYWNAYLLLLHDKKAIQ